MQSGGEVPSHLYLLSINQILRNIYVCVRVCSPTSCFQVVVVQTLSNILSYG